MSSINPNNIDGQYPIAGQDNDSQGFRDNFTNIKNNFTFAYNELTDLQSKAVLKSALSGGSLNNDMAYAQLISPQLLKSVETINDLGSKSGVISPISWADGNFQKFTTGGSVTLSFSNWPTSGYYAKLRLQANVTNVAHTITFPSAVSQGLSDIQGVVGQVLTPATTGIHLFELTTDDNGSTITIQDLLRNYDITTTGSSGAFTGLNVSGNVLTSGAVINNLNVNGTATLAGNVAVTGLQHYYPTANVAITGNLGISRILVTPTTSPAIVSLFVDVTLPNVTTDGTVLSISSNVAVNELRTLSPWVGTTVSPSANVSLTAGSKAEYLYRSADSKWYKVG
jgi:hypothetical protein